MIYCNLFHLNRLSDTNALRPNAKKKRIKNGKPTQSQPNHRPLPASETRRRDESKKAWNLQYILQLAVKHAPLPSTGAASGASGNIASTAPVALCAYLNVAWAKNKQDVCVAADGPMISRRATLHCPVPCTVTKSDLNSCANIDRLTGYAVANQLSLVALYNFACSVQLLSLVLTSF